MLMVNSAGFWLFSGLSRLLNNCGNWPMVMAPETWITRPCLGGSGPAVGKTKKPAVSSLIWAGSSARLFPSMLSVKSSDLIHQETHLHWLSSFGIRLQ